MSPGLIRLKVAVLWAAVVDGVRVASSIAGCAQAFRTAYKWVVHRQFGLHSAPCWAVQILQDRCETLVLAAGTKEHLSYPEQLSG
jgi:hypothetical protein